MTNVRLVALQGSDEFNVVADGVQHQERVRPDHSFIVDHKTAAALMASPICGFREEYDDESTVREIQLLASVLQDRTLANSINGAITSRKLLALQ
jgi:hypothetical protein